MNEIALIKDYKEISKSLPEHEKMLEVISQGAAEIHRATSLFGKSQSQFMDNLLTVSHPTPIRNLRQILAEMDRARSALKENFFKHKKKEIEIKKKTIELESCENELDRELIELEIMEYQANKEESQKYISGAIRKLANYQIQYNSILSTLGVSSFNEIDFEVEEERYHIMKAFEQGVCAARSRGGVIDEGNHIYFTQIGINSGVAQKEVLSYLSRESDLIQKGEEPTHAMFLMFLNVMAEKFKGCSIQYAKYKGQTGEISEIAALKKGDMRFLEGKNEL